MPGSGALWAAGERQSINGRAPWGLCISCLRYEIAGTLRRASWQARAAEAQFRDAHVLGPAAFREVCILRLQRVPTGHALLLWYITAARRFTSTAFTRWRSRPSRSRPLGHLWALGRHPRVAGHW